MDTRLHLKRLLPAWLTMSLRQARQHVAFNRGASALSNSFAAEKFDREYAAGRWKYLAGLSEAPRYGVISAYCAEMCSGGGLLDLGCGEGILARWLHANSINRYFGVDFSAAAIDRARANFSDQHVFAVGDVASYAPQSLYDVIVFNEVLYYFERPQDILGRYGQYLRPGGHFIISLWECNESDTAWHRAKTSVRVIDEIYLRNQAQTGWRIFLCQPLNAVPR